MLSLYVPATGWLHRMPAGPKLAMLALVAMAVAALPSTWVTAMVLLLPLVLYAGSGMGVGRGLRVLADSVWGLRWVIVVTAAGQLIFLGLEPAVANTGRVVAALLVVNLVPVSTPVSALLDALERGLAPLAWCGVDPGRAALLLTLTITTIPVIARLAAEVRDAQRARGLRPSLRRGALPLLVSALRHADDLGEGLAARGIR